MVALHTVTNGAASDASDVNQFTALYTGGVFYDAKYGYGAVGDGLTDDTAALQACLTAAFNAPGGTMFIPPGTYLVTSALAIPADTAGAVRILGAGRPRSFTGGGSGDPVAAQGTTIRTSSTTASVILASVAAAVRQSITIESITIEGNPAGTTGHGIHFSAPSAVSALIVTLRDVSVIGAKQHGIFFDGDVFECQLYNIRANSCGSAGFKAAANTGGLPGETRMFGGSFTHNDIGIDLGGGGSWSLHGITSSYNTHEGVVANAVIFRCYELQLEVNGTSSGNQATMTSLNGALLYGVQCTAVAGGTGIGLSFVGCIGGQVVDYAAISSVTGGGYLDLKLDNSSAAFLIEGYFPDDAVDRTSLGTFGGHAVRKGGVWYSGQTHGQQVISSAITGADQFDARKYDSFLSTRTAAAITRVINWPSSYTTFQDGQRLTFEIFNNTAGATTTTWDAVFHLAGAWVDPAAGKTRTITFEWNNTRTIFVELSRSAADIT